jgi:hypothetical protein
MMKVKPTTTREVVLVGLLIFVPVLWSSGCSLVYESTGVNKAINDYYFPDRTNNVQGAKAQELQTGNTDQRTSH